MKEKYLKIALLGFVVIVLVQAYFLYGMNRTIEENKAAQEIAKSFVFPKIVPLRGISTGVDFFKEMDRLRREMETSFMDFEDYIHSSPSFGEISSVLHRSPRFDMKETNGKYIITVEVPGSNKSNIKTKIENGQLIISAKLSEEKEDNSTTYYRHERHMSSYQRNIILPADIDEKSLQSEYKDGLLIIKLDKKKI